jgi:serine/threonine-protein kinase
MLKHCTQCGEAQDDDARFCPRCGTPQLPNAPATKEADDPLLGKVIAERYLLVEKIGRGASGTIYRADHTTLHKKVAVKVLHPQLSRDDTALERFRREATTVGQLDNDHILQVLDFGRADAERLFFAMEYLDGEPLSSVIDRDKQLAVPRLIDILVQVGEALVEAHGLGYIHRDLRPRNVFLIKRRGRADFVKLLDFGLAKLILPDVEAKQTAMGMTFGDPRYMSPEQARGDTMDRRADIYSLGAIAYEALTGVPPYAGGGTFEILKQHLDAPVPHPRDKRPDCPAWLDTVVHKALAKKPDDRFATVLKLLDCLREQKAPVEDQAEKTEHASLSAAATQLGMTPSPVAPAEKPAKETLFLSQLPAPKEKDKAKDKKADKKRDNGAAAGEMKGDIGTHPTVPASGPTVVVDQNPVNGSAQHKVVEPAVVAAPAVVAVPVAEAVPPQPTPEPLPPTPEPRKREPSGEWFEQEMQAPRAPGVTTYDDVEDELPKRNKGPIIIAAVAGGLTVAGIVVFLLLPKPQHKPVRGEEPAPAAAAPAAAAPAPVAAAPAPAAAAPVAAAAPSAAPAAVVAAPKLELPKPEQFKPAAELAKSEPVKETPKAEKPEPKETKAKVELAKAEPKETKAPPPVKDDKHGHDKHAAAPPDGKKRTPDGFKDPFADASAGGGARADSGQADFFVKLGRQKLAASDVTAATANFNKAREYDPKNPDAIAGLGEVSFEQGDYNGAAVHLKQALKLSPNRPRFLVLLGQAYYKMGRAKDAVGEYRKALRLDPGNQEAQHSLEVAERKLASGG